MAISLFFWEWGLLPCPAHHLLHTVRCCSRTCKLPDPLNHWCLCCWLRALSSVLKLGRHSVCSPAGWSPTPVYLILSLYSHPQESVLYLCQIIQHINDRAPFNTYTKLQINNQQESRVRIKADDYLWSLIGRITLSLKQEKSLEES